MPSHEPSIPRRADWIVAAVIIALLAMLFSPALAQNVGDARRNSCLNNCKQLILGLLNHEAARKFYPAASTAEWSVVPGNDDDAKRAGYSWQTQILPFMEDQKLWTAMRDASENFAKAPLALRIAGPSGEVVAATTPVTSFVCPAFAGKPVVDVTKSGYKAGGGAPALTNYFALSASHLLKDDAGRWGLGVHVNPAIQLQGNGILAFYSQTALDAAGSFTKLRGASMASIRDGTSNTLVFGESREQAYAAWIDGQVTWVVAAWPQNPEAPRPLKDAANPNAPATLGWPEDQRPAVVSPLAMQRFGTPDDQAGVYLPEAMWSGWSDRKFGPSGNHEGVAVHTFADGHSKAIADTIDATVYLHLVTRAGQEVVNEADF